jgi:hypothetical protein
LFGLENYGNGFVSSETELQVNISALAGATITSATLSYTLLNGGDGLTPLSSQQVEVTSYTSHGTLGFNATPPSNLGTTVFTSTELSRNSVDVTSLVQGSVNGGSGYTGWLGLFLTPLGPGYNPQYTYTSGYGDNSADVQLTVNYTPATSAVPEPATVTLLGIGAVCALGYTWRRRKQAV